MDRNEGAALKGLALVPGTQERLWVEVLRVLVRTEDPKGVCP